MVVKKVTIENTDNGTVEITTTSEPQLRLEIVKAIVPLAEGMNSSQFVSFANTVFEYVYSNRR